VPNGKYLPWRIAGAYFESCNCDAICPCRTIGGVPGGRSTHGICFGALSWRIDEGQVGAVDLGGLNAALVYRYSDDEDRSPWRFNLHVDARGDQEQRAALADILVGRLGGPLIEAQPWVRKPSELLHVRTSTIAIDRVGPRNTLRIEDTVAITAYREVPTDERVSCIVPGHHRPGIELYAEELVVHDDPFAWELTGNCAFVSTFDYRSGD
jgi:hypothetical protein